MSGGFFTLTADLGGLRQETRRLSQAARAGAAGLTRDLALELLGRIVRLNPVDTGRSRAGWHVSLGRPSNWVPDQGGPYPDADQVLAREKSRIRGTRESRVSLVNNVEYIVPLELGRSRQAPAGMVRVSLETMRGWAGLRRAQPSGRRAPVLEQGGRS